MKTKTVCVYDDHAEPDARIRNIIGNKSFGDVVLKRVSVKERTLTFLRKQAGIGEVVETGRPWQPETLLGQVRERARGAVLLHLFSDFVVTDRKAAEILLRKMAYAETNYVCTCGGASVFLVMTDPEEYCGFVRRYGDCLRDTEVYAGAAGFRFEQLATDAFLHIGEYENFLRYISGGFDVRFFNSVRGDGYTVVKSSEKKDKILAEYRFYHMLPDEMKMWFVMPYDYREEGSWASYRMERYHMPDLAVRWVHGAVSTEEMDRLLSKAFRFIGTRKKRAVSREEYEKVRDGLYLEKVYDRIGQMKSHELYPLLNRYMTGVSETGGPDGLMARYEGLYREFCAYEAGSRRDGADLVIGHGDLCFSNMLYDRDTDLLKLIDPKGALEEGQMWTDPYYDVAKLSHSVCGLYDFFNSGLFQIVLDADLGFRLEIDFDNGEYKELFRRHAEANGYSYPLVRLYEASLFLSMLPLHTDNPRKVFGFILNAANIMEEAEACLKG